MSISRKWKRKKETERSCLSLLIQKCVFIFNFYHVVSKLKRSPISKLRYLIFFFVCLGFFWVFFGKHFVNTSCLELIVKRRHKSK